MHLNEKGHRLGRDLECGTDVLGMASLLEAGEPTLSLAPEYAGWICVTNVVTCIEPYRRLEDS